MKKNNFAENLDQIYRDLIDIQINENDSFKTSMEKFYDVMRKWGICQGTREGNGVICNNAEWNMCFQVFKNYKLVQFDIWLALSNPPDDLIAYD